MKKRFLCLLLALCIAITCTSCNNIFSKGSKESVSDKTNDYSEDYLYEMADEIFFGEISGNTLDLHFLIAHPENYDIEYFSPTFGTYYSEEFAVEADEQCDYYLKELESFKYDEFSSKGKLIYDMLMRFLTYAKKLNQYEHYYEALSPTSGFQSLLPVLLAEYQFYDKDDITDYILLLGDMPRYFSEIADYQRIKSKDGFFMSDKTADEIITQCQDFIKNPENNLLIECFDDKIDNFKNLTKDEATLLKEDNRDAVLDSVITAYEILIDVLTELKGTGTNDKGLSEYEKGKEYYELYAQYTTGSDKTMFQMKKALNNRMTYCSNQITGLIIKDNSIFDKMAAFQFPLNAPEEIIEYLKTAISEDFPALSSVGYTIKYVDESLKDYLNPAMYLIPPIDAYNQNFIYINTDPDEDNSTMFSTVAHEGFPGHLYQNIYFLNTKPERIQSLIGTNGYSEGWGLYTEIYSYALTDTEKNLVEALQLNSEYIYCLYALSDIGVHYDGWDLEKYIAFWAEQGIEDIAFDEMYQYTVTSPAAYLPYVIGYIEIMDLRTKAETALVDEYNIKTFHKFLLDSGPASFSILDKMMDEWIIEQRNAN